LRIAILFVKNNSQKALNSIKLEDRHTIRQK